MSSCAVCKDAFSNDDILVCAVCQGGFHVTCAGMTSSQFRKLTNPKKSKWMCVSCSNLEEPAKSENSSVLTKIQAQTDELKSLLSSKFEDLKVSIDFNSSIIQDLKTTIIDLQNSNKMLQRKQDELTSENTNMKKLIVELKQDIVDLKQYSRRCNLEISNLPESENEDIKQVMSNIQKIADISFVDNITALHRVPSFNKEKPKPIICQLNNKPLRDSLLKKLRSIKISARQVNPRFPDLPVYFNEHLAPEIKNIFFHARKAKTELKFKFCWTRDGKIFLRKDESSKIFRINSLDDLNVPMSN